MGTEHGWGMPSEPVHIFISTGEVSGDLQGALLIDALRRQAHQRGLTLKLSALGGPRMAMAGATLLADTTAIGSVGIFEALPYLLPTLRLQNRVRRQLQAQPPDLAVYIDYMTPNMVLGRFIRRRLPTVTTAYYIAPQQWVWAFSQKDTQSLVQVADRMLAIFPQEADYYRQFGADVTWVGHPLLDQFSPPPDPQAARRQLGLAADDTIVTLLPASRHQEVAQVLPPMFQAAQQIQAQMPSVRFLVPVSATPFRAAIVRGIERYRLQATLIEADGRQAIAAADVALTKSGTVNLEIALMQVPQVVVYRLNPFTAWIAHHLLRFRVRFVSPVNLVQAEAIVPEFIQWQATPSAIAESVLALLRDDAAREQMQAGYSRLRQTLGQPGACDRAAIELLSLATQQTRQQTAVS